MLKKLLLLLILLVPLASAYEVDYHLESGKVLVSVSIESGGFDYELPEDAKAVSLKLNSEIIEPEIIDNILIVPEGKVEFSFITKSYLEEGKLDYFVAEFDSLKTGDVKIELTLPLKASLDSAFPKESRLETDGKRIIVVWEKYLEEGDNFSMFVKYEKGFDYKSIIIPLIALIAVLIFILRKKPKFIKKTIVKRKIHEHLKEDERIVIDALKKKGGKCEQATLRIVTDFSKASLSRLLKDMEDRKLIKKIKQGKKNIVILK